MAIATIKSKQHRRRIKTEEKAKVVTAVLGDRIDSIHGHAISISHQDELKKGMNSYYSSSSWCNASYSSNRPGAK